MKREWPRETVFVPPDLHAKLESIIRKSIRDGERITKQSVILDGLRNAIERLADPKRELMVARYRDLMEDLTAPQQRAVDAITALLIALVQDISQQKSPTPQ